MIKFLGHEIGNETESVQLTDDLTTFAPEEAGESCLMTGVNEPDYKTFLDQKSFLQKFYEHMMKA